MSSDAVSQVIEPSPEEALRGGPAYGQPLIGSAAPPSADESGWAPTGPGGGPPPPPVPAPKIVYLLPLVGGAWGKYVTLGPTSTPDTFVKTALDAFRACGATHYARTDYLQTNPPQVAAATQVFPLLGPLPMSLHHPRKTPYKFPPIDYDKKRRLPSARALDGLKAPAPAPAPPASSSAPSVPLAYAFEDDGEDVRAG